jgi:hypothetical protein
VAGADVDLQRRVDELTREKREAAAAMAKLKSQLDALQLRSGGGGAKGGVRMFSVLLFVLAAFGAGLGVGQQGLLALPMVSAPKPPLPTPKARGKRDEL